MAKRPPPPFFIFSMSKASKLVSDAILGNNIGVERGEKTTSTLFYFQYE
nr:MAG TPA: hypothetical protein [Caudoviricetes sp.]